MGGSGRRLRSGLEVSQGKKIAGGLVGARRRFRREFWV